MWYIRTYVSEQPATSVFRTKVSSATTLTTKAVDSSLQNVVKLPTCNRYHVPQGNNLHIHRRQNFESSHIQELHKLHVLFTGKQLRTQIWGNTYNELHAVRIYTTRNSEEKHAAVEKHGL